MEHTRVVDATPRMKRAANEIMRGAATFDDVLPLPYYCECAAPACRRAIWLTASAYDRFHRRGNGAPLLADEHMAHLAETG